MESFTAAFLWRVCLRTVGEDWLTESLSVECLWRVCLRTVGED